MTQIDKRIQVNKNLLGFFCLLCLLEFLRAESFPFLKNLLIKIVPNVFLDIDTRIWHNEIF